MKPIIRWLRRWLGVHHSSPGLVFIPIEPSPTPPYVPMTDDERRAAGDAARAERARMIAEQVHVNEFQDSPEVCAARAADPDWRAEQIARSEAAAEAFVTRRAEAGMPLERKGRY